VNSDRITPNVVKLYSFVIFCIKIKDKFDNNKPKSLLYIWYWFEIDY